MPILTMHDDLVLFTLYGCPRDYPNQLVVRRWVVSAHGTVPQLKEPAVITPWSVENLWLLHMLFQEWLCMRWCERADSDDPVIMGVWI